MECQVPIEILKIIKLHKDYNYRLVKIIWYNLVLHYLD